MAFSFSNWFKSKPDATGETTDPTKSAGPAVATGTTPPPGVGGVEAETAVPSARPAAALKSAVPNTIKPVALHESALRSTQSPVPLPSNISMPKSHTAPTSAGGRSIAFPSGSSAAVNAPQSFQRPAPPRPAAPTAQPAVAATPPPAMPVPDVSIHLELGDFLEKIPSHLLKEESIDPTRAVVFKASDLYSDLARGRAAVPVSAIHALCPEIFRGPISDTEDVEVPLPLAKLVMQLAPTLQRRSDQVAEENVGQIETPFLQVALEDNARIPKAAASAPVPAAASAASKPAAAAEPPPAVAPRVPTPAPAVRSEAPIAMPHQPAPVPAVVSRLPASMPAMAPVTPPPPVPQPPAVAPVPPQPAVINPRPAQISAVRSNQAGSNPASPSPLAPPSGSAPLGSHMRPPSTVRASVAGGKIRLSGPAIAKRGMSFGGNAQAAPTVAPAPVAAHPLVIKPVAPLATPPSASAAAPPPAGTILRRTARIQIPAITVLTNPQPPAQPQQKAVSLQPTAPVQPPRPLPTTEPPPSFQATPGGAAPGSQMLGTRPIPTVPPPSVLRPIPPLTTPQTIRATFPAPPPLPFAPPAPTRLMPLTIPVREPQAPSAPPVQPVVAPTTRTEALPVDVPAVVEPVEPAPPEPVAAREEVAPGQEIVNEPMAAPVSESPALETPVAAADTTVENTIRLALAPILRSLPNSFLSHVDAADFVEDAAQVSLPLDLITPQLAYGRVSVTREVFEAGLPAQHRGILASADAPAEIPLPLQEIFQNLPMGALSQRQDQVLEEVRPTIPTPFSQKAEEDAKALLAAQPPAALETEPAHEPSSTAPDQPEATTEPVPHAEPTATLQLLTEKEDEIAPAQAEEHSTVGAAPARAEMTETPAAGSIEPVPISTPQLEPPHREESTVESPVEPEGAVPSAEPVLADTADAGLAAASSLQESEAAASRESHPVAAFAPNEHPVPHEAPVSDESSTAAAPSSEIEPPLAPVMAEEMAPTGFAVEASDTLPPAASAATEPELPQAPPHAPVPTLPADDAASQNARREQAQEALREVFMIEDDLDAKKVVKLASQLPGLKGCVVMFADGLKLAGSVAADQESAGFCAMAPAFFQKARHFSREMNLGDLRDVTLHTERGLLLSFFMHEDICLCVAQAGRGFLPGVREKLQIVTRELAALYAKQH